jgi:hypothetical protein
MSKTYKLEKLKPQPNQPAKVRSHIVQKSEDTKTDDWWIDDQYDDHTRDLDESGIYYQKDGEY